MLVSYTYYEFNNTLSTSHTYEYIAPSFLKRLNSKFA